MKVAGVEWRKVPVALWAYVALSFGGVVVTVIVAPVAVAPALFSVGLLAAWSYFLLRGIRWLWITTLVIGVLTIAFDFASGNVTWYGDLLGLLGLGLLLLPATRRFFYESRAGEAT